MALTRTKGASKKPALYIHKKYYYYHSKDKNIWSSFHDFSHLLGITRVITMEQAFKLSKKLGRSINGEG